MNKGDLNLVSSHFVNNTAANTAHGGVLYVTDYVSKDFITLAGSYFHSNRAISGGVITLQANDNLTVTESTFSHNSTNSGGAIFLQTHNKLII